MAKMSKEVMGVFNDPNSTKVLATAGTVLEINAVPKGSLRAIREDLLAFADISGNKTNSGFTQGFQELPGHWSGLFFGQTIFHLCESFSEPGDSSRRAAMGWALRYPPAEVVVHYLPDLRGSLFRYIR